MIKNKLIQPSDIVITQIDPVVYFVDHSQIICSEQYNKDGDWWGWKREIIEDSKEYFRRRLIGK